ncbi:MAG: glycosyltransferase family 4 protein [Pseudomonadota bacterium]
MLDIPKVANVLPTDQAPHPLHMRIAILSYRSEPKVGGQGVYVDYLSSALARAGAKVDVISGPPYPNLSGDVDLVKLPSLDLFAQPHNGNLALRPKHLLSPTDTYEYFGHLSGKFVEPYTFGQRAFQYFKRHRKTYDVVLDNQSLSIGVGKIGSRLGVPLTTMIHHPITHDRKLALDAAPDWQHRWLVRRWYEFHHMQVAEARKLKAITCPSEHAKTDIVDQFGVDPDRIQPIPLGVDRSSFCPSDKIERSTQTLITTASSDTPLKGLSFLLEAYHQILQTHPDCELVVIGTLREGLARQTIKRLGLDGRVQFKSNLSRSDLADEFRRAAIAITPSLYEGFGLPAAEAMSCGTPVIVTDGGALPEVAGDAGIVVPKGDSGALADAITGLLDNPDQRRAIGAACLQRAETHFDWAAIAPKYLDFFQGAIEQQVRR